MSYKLEQERYLMPSPAGAYYCITTKADNAARKLLRQFLQQQAAPLVTVELIETWFSPEQALGLQTLNYLQDLGWLQTMLVAEQVGQGSLETLLPDLLQPLSSETNALLTDSQGFCLSSVGFTHESAEEISALSADLVTLHGRHEGLLNNNLKLPSANWGLLDAAGHSQLGFWPLYIGKELFSLAIGGAPCLHHQAFMRLVWLLHSRYASSVVGATDYAKIG